MTVYFYFYYVIGHMYSVPFTAQPIPTQTAYHHELHEPSLCVKSWVDIFHDPEHCSYFISVYLCTCSHPFTALKVCDCFGPILCWEFHFVLPCDNIYLESLSVTDCVPRKYWAVVSGEVPLQTATHAKGALQGFPFTTNWLYKSVCLLLVL